MTNDLSKKNDKFEHGTLLVTTSWDDGDILDLKIAELLNKYGLKGTFYIPKSYSKLSLSSHDLLEIDRIHELGAHTLSHPILTGCSTAKAEKEISGSKAYLEEIAGHKIEMFCYPAGRYNLEVKSLVKKAGFIGARTCQPSDSIPLADPFEWPITLQASDASHRLTFEIWRRSRLSLSSLFDWPVRARSLFDIAVKKGGIFHLWGHSTEIQGQGDWDKLDGVLRYISNNNAATYLTNGMIIGMKK
jgi:peptidoglycan-N-acetylglucosamine deacetylase